MQHESVLLQEAIHALNIKPDGIYVDGTVGRGGHAKELISKLTTGHLYAFDKDEVALEETKVNLLDDADKVTLIHQDFRFMEEELHKRGIEKVLGILLDLGVSSPQFDDPSRGFSYRYDAPLDMRMDLTQSLDAKQVVNNYPVEDLTKILKEYGEERYASSIAKKIDEARKKAPIETTYQLVDIVRSALPQKELNKKGHPAKQTFQAIRIEVNDELGALENGLRSALGLLDHGGRLAVITFHSLEDRLVKSTFKQNSLLVSVLPMDLPFTHTSA